MALEIQHSSDVILQRVNRFFGWSAVGRLALRQAPLSRRDRPAPPARRTRNRWRRSPKPCPRSRMRNCGPRWRGSAPRSSEIEPAARSGSRGPPLPQLSFQASERLLLRTSSGVNAPIREQTLIITRRAFTAALSLTGLGRSRRVLAAAPDHGRDGAKRCRRRQAAVAAGHGAWPRQRLGDHHRIRVDDLPALRGLQRKRVSEDQVGIHRQRQDPLRVPRIPARHQGRGGLDAGALHRQGRCAEIFRRHRPAVQAAERLGDEEHHGDADPDRQAGRPQPAGRSRTA